MTAIPVCKAARGEIIDCQYYEEGENNLPPKSFFPIDSLKAYLTEDKIREILRCNCPECSADLRLFGNLDPDAITPQITGNQPELLRKHIVRPAYALFSLLIYVEHPLLIIGFLNADFYDYDLERSTTHPDTFSTSNLKHYTQDFSSLNPTGFKRFIRTFTAAVPEFAIPYMDHGYFSRYSANTKLPFITESEIGQRLDEQGRLTAEGANGRVFRFKIYKEYKKFPSSLCAKDLEWFARKKIETPEFMAYMEKEYLQYAQRFRDDHIVKLIKAYRLGDSINLIFPLAKGNLNHLLRDPNTGYGNERAGPLESCSAWKQLLGLAKALENIQGYKPDSGHSENPEFSERLCIHFDLKPENILVEDDGNWVITDFGHAAITYAQYGRTPRVANRQGTDAYAPPEVDIDNMEMGRRYDVWSLGCIMLEVAAFVILGYSGLAGSDDPADRFQGLDQARQGKPVWSRNGDSRFFYRATRDGPPVVKAEIAAFIDFLKTHVNSNPENSERSKTFFGKVIDLIEQMLQPRVEDRIDMVEVVRNLSAAIEQASPGSAPGELQMVRAEGESVIGGPALHRIRLWHKVPQKRETSEGWEWNQASLEAFEHESGYMRLLIWSHSPNQRPTDPSFFRNQVKIIPHYAFWSQAQVPDDKIWIQLLRFSSGPPSELPNCKFSFSSRTGHNALHDARVVQSKLTSQHIEASFALASVRLDQFVSMSEKAFNALGRKIGFNKAQAKAKAEEYVSYRDLGSATIQLWIEQVDKAEEVRRQKRSSYAHSTNSNRGPRVESVNKLRPRRAVLYLHRHGFICTIKMDVNWVLGADPNDEYVLYFEPNEPGRDPHFVASWLRPTLEEQEKRYPAGVPLDPEALELLEHLDHIEADRFKLRFFTLEDRNAFYSKYMDVKKEWDLQREGFKKSQTFSPVNRSTNRFKHSKYDFLKEQVPEQKARFRTSPASENAEKPEPETTSPKLDKGKGRAIEPPEPHEMEDTSFARQESDNREANGHPLDTERATNHELLTVPQDPSQRRPLYSRPPTDDRRDSVVPYHQRKPSGEEKEWVPVGGRTPNARPRVKKK